MDSLENLVCMWTQPYLFTFVAAETALEAGWHVRQTQTCLPTNTFTRQSMCPVWNQRTNKHYSQVWNMCFQLFMLFASSKQHRWSTSSYQH